MGLFISYSSQDAGAIEPLRRALQRAHQQVWMDEELGGGEAWWRTILEQIRNCEVFIVALSNNSLASKPCQAELRYARALQRPILPVQIGPVTNVRLNPLAETQMVDFRNPTADSGIQLIWAVQAQQTQRQPLPADLPEEPPVPFAYLMRLAHNISESQLSAREQADLLSELKHGLEEDGDDPAARADIRQLLCLLRDRHDVAWRVRSDIESVLDSIDTKPSTVHAGGVTSSQDQNVESPSSRLSSLPPPSGQPWPNSGATSQPYPTVKNPPPSPPPGTGPQPFLGPPPAGPSYDGGGRKARRSPLIWILAGVGGVVLMFLLLGVIGIMADTDSTGSSHTRTQTTPTTDELVIVPEKAAEVLTNTVSQQTGFTPTDVTCASGVEAKVGATFDCRFTGPDGQYTAHMTVARIAGDTVEFNNIKWAQS